MSRIRGVLFDKDGTLVDFEATWSAIARRLAMEAAGGDSAVAEQLLELGGFDSTAGRFRADSVIAAGTNADIVTLWHPTLSREDRIATISRFDLITAEEGALAAVPIAGLSVAIENLHAQGHRLGLATNDSTRGGERTLEALGVGRFFDAIYGYDAVARPKPAPDVVLAFADMSGLRPAEIAMVGDNRHDLEAGKAAGAGLVVGVLSGTGTRETLSPLADVLLDSVADLPALFAARA